MQIGPSDLRWVARYFRHPRPWHESLWLDTSQPSGHRVTWVGERQVSLHEGFVLALQSGPSLAEVTVWLARLSSGHWASLHRPASCATRKSWLLSTGCGFSTIGFTYRFNSQGFFFLPFLLALGFNSLCHHISSRTGDADRAQCLLPSALRGEWDESETSE